MKNITIVLIIILFSILGIYSSINYIDDKYQSTIAVAIATASIQLILFFLKLEFDRNSHKNTKSYGVVYDKKFIIYNDLIAQIIDARSYFVYFTKVKNFNKQEELFNKIEDIKRIILKNRLIISNEVFFDVNMLYAKIRSNYDNYTKAILSKEKDEGTIENVESYIKANRIDNQISEILDVMRKELNVF